MSDVFTTQEVGWGGDEWAKRLVERLRQNPLRRTRGARDFAELEDEIDRLLAENDRLRAILAALREPSKGAWSAALAAFNNASFPSHAPRLINALRAAVTAAEQEVGRE